MVFSFILVSIQSSKLCCGKELQILIALVQVAPGKLLMTTYIWTKSEARYEITELQNFQ